MNLEPDRLIERVHPNSNPTNICHSVFCYPEFFNEETTLDNLLYPKRVVIGAKSEGVGVDMIMDLYNWVPRERFHFVDSDRYKAVEVASTLNNVLLGMCSTIGNVTAEICKEVGVDVETVMNLVDFDGKFQGLFTPANAAIEDSDIQRDLKFVSHLCTEKYYKLSDEALVIKAAVTLQNKNLRKRKYQEREGL